MFGLSRPSPGICIMIHGPTFHPTYQLHEVGARPVDIISKIKLMILEVWRVKSQSNRWLIVLLAQPLVDDEISYGIVRYYRFRSSYV